jgi:pimeloyl-ACP methyl ester carboxylesterase
MNNKQSVRISHLTLVAALSLGWSLAAEAADPAVQTVSLTTGDGAEIAARYFVGNLGGRSPAVLVLDDLGDEARPTACDAIARKLAAQGCTVLCFDDRGHGRSTGVTPDFWADTTNRQLVRGFKSAAPPEKIAASDFRLGYLPTLLNDVAAARAYLEGRNDVGECNTGQVFVVGFGGGATLGQLWVVSEWSRFRATGFQSKLASAPEGRGVAGCVWVAPRFALDRQAVPMFDLVKKAEQKKSLFVGIVHGPDATSARFARQCKAAFNPKSGNGLIVSEAVSESDSPPAARSETTAVIDRLIGNMRKRDDPPPWDDRDFADRRYVWAFPGTPVELAKDEGELQFRPLPVSRLLGGR